MDIKEAKAAKIKLQDAIAALLAEFAIRTGTRVVDLDIVRSCPNCKVPRYIVDAEVRL